MKIITEDNIFNECALLLTVTDEELEIIKNNPKYYLDPEFVKKVTISNGKNIIVTFLTVNNNFSIILKRMKYLLENYESVSWWSRGHTKFYTRKKR